MTLVSNVTEKPPPQCGDNSKPQTCCPHPGQSSLLNSVHCAHRMPSPEVCGIRIPTASPYPELLQPPGSGLVGWCGGGGRDLFLMLFCDSGRIFISERVHCLPQPRGQQGVEEEGSFKQRQTTLGLVRIPRAPVE